MKWDAIYEKYPGKFILVSDFIEERLSESQFRITEAEVISAFDDFNEMLQEYRKFKDKGKDVLYSLPNCKDFIIEESPSMSFFR